MLKGSRLDNSYSINPSNAHVPQKDIDLFCQTASILLKRGNIRYALKNYESALKKCGDDNLDKAFVLRRLASVIVNGNIKDNAAIAKIYFQQSIQIHETKINSGNPENKIGCLEYQRCLNSLCSIAANLKDGSLLEETAKKLLIFARQTKNHRFEFDALDYLYMVAFSLNNLDSAQKKVDDSIAIAKEHKEIEYSTCYRHLAKIKLLKKDPAIEIINIFWICYDAHKKLAPSQNKTRLLTDDLTFLFILKVYQYSNIKAVLFYINKQAKPLLSEEETLILMENLRKKGNVLERGDAIPLCHSFFSESKQLRPHFSLPLKKIESPPTP